MQCQYITDFLCMCTEIAQPKISCFKIMIDKIIIIIIVYLFPSQDNDTHAVLIVSTSNRNVPINVMFQNKTLSYDTTFLSFEEKKLSDEYYTLPSFCNKSVSRKRPSIEAAKLNVVPSFPTIKVKNSDGPKTGYYVVHPVVKEMVEKAKMRFGNI